MTITSPSGRTYNWNKSTPPTAEDMAALQEFDAKQGGSPAPAGLPDPSNLPGYTPDAMDPFQGSPLGVSGTPAFKKAATTVADMGMEGAGASGGQALGAATGPFAPVAVPALGAIGGVLGNAAGQARGMIAGDRKKFSLGELLAAGTAAMIPGGSLLKAGAKQVGKEMLKQGGANVAAKQVQVATDEGRVLTPQEAAMAAGGGAFGVATMKGLDKGVQVTKATTKAIQNAIRDRTLAQSRAAGYVIPPSHLNPSTINVMLESVGGKAATAQEATIRNQEITNLLAKKAAGLPSGPAPISEEILREARDRLSRPMREVAALDGGTRKYQKAVGFSVTNETEKLPSGQQLLDDLRNARFEATEYHKLYQTKPNPEYRKLAESLDDKAVAIEGRIDQMAIDAGRPDLVAKMRNARKALAKTYDVERALNLDTGDVSAGVLARRAAIGKKSPYTGDLKTISAFYKSNQRYAGNGWNTSTPGVSALNATMGGLAGIAGARTGGIPAAVAGFVAPFLPRQAARSLILSKPYQNLMANPFYGSTTQADMGANAFRLSVEAGSRR